ncbi:hypothetical protein O3M35_003125 [Rhynocoris fuscipes]|uniref:Uncharacterized protein n=1 Tax=Rhynocoris fuscipes TaxID=488301 RepID=A0AAW1CI08_9HEMI
MDAESTPQDTESTPHVSPDDKKRKKKNRQSDGDKVVSVDQLDIESSPHVSTDERKRVKKRRKSDGDKEENDGHMDAESTPQDTESTPHVSTDDRKNKKKNRQSDGEKESVIDIHSSTTDIDLDVSSPNKREKKSKKFVEKDVKSDDWKSDNELNVEDKPRRMADKNSLQRKTYKENDSNQSISEILLNLPLDDYSLSEKEIAKIQKKISYRFSDSVYTKLEKLRIEITWKLSPIHQVEVIFRGSCNNNPKYKEMIGVVKKGLFETYENQAIVSRWNQFCQLYDFNVKKDFLLFLPKLTGCHCHPLPKDQRIKFVQFIAQDLPKRSLHSVYYRFIEMFKYYKKGVFSQEEDNLILLMHKVLPVNRVYSVLSNILYRSRYTVYRRYKRLEKRGINNQSHESESFDENEPPTSSKKRKRRIINVNDKDEENYEQQTSKIEILSSDCDIDFEKNNTSKEISSISKTPSNLNVITNSNQILETVLKPSGPFKIKPLNLDADVTNLKLDQETVDLDEDFDSLKSVISNITGSQDLTKWDNKARKVSFWKRIGRKCNLSPAKAKLQYLCRIRVKELKPKKSHNCNSLILQIIDCLKKNNWKKWKHVDWKLVSEELNNLGDVFLYYTFRKYVKKYVPETSWRKLKDCINHLSEHTVLPSCC